MKINDEYECDYLPGETLSVVEIYNKKQGVVKVGSSNRKILFSVDSYEGTSLSLAHVANVLCDMKIKTKEIQW